MTEVVIASAKPIAEMTDQERKARWKELSKKVRADQSEVIGLPGIHYFWACHIGHGSEAELIRLETMGYSITREPDPKEVLAGRKKPAIIAAGLKEDGRYVRGDVMLMQCPQEDYEFFLLDIEQRHEDTMKGIQEEFISNAEMQGAPTFTVTKPKK